MSAINGRRPKRLLLCHHTEENKHLAIGFHELLLHVLGSWANRKSSVVASWRCRLSVTKGCQKGQCFHLIQQNNFQITVISSDLSTVAGLYFESMQSLVLPRSRIRFFPMHLSFTTYAQLDNKICFNFCKPQGGNLEILWTR